MADLVNSNISILGVIPRVGLSFGFGDDTVEEACRKHGVNANTFLLICSVYSLDGYLPSSEFLKKVDIRDVVKCLRRSHSYYTDAANALADGIEQMIEPCDDKYKKIIWKFFTEYKEELQKHFEYEEKMVFPYVESVLEHHKNKDFTILQYEENHSNIEEKLDDLKNIVMKYLPKQCDTAKVYNVLLRIFTLEQDLRKHTIIEDDILVPIVNRLEDDETEATA